MTTTDGSSLFKSYCQNELWKQSASSSFPAKFGLSSPALGLDVRDGHKFDLIKVSDF